VSVWHREADFQSTVSNAAHGAREIVRRYDTGNEEGEKPNKKNENNNEAAMGNQSLTVSAITKNNGQSDSGGEGGEWKRKLCVCVVLVQQFSTGEKRVCISDERKNAQPYRASGLGISRSSFLCLPLRLSTRRRKMKQLELRRQMSHLFEHDELFCLNERKLI
jgi:hypothetical protein